MATSKSNNQSDNPPEKWIAGALIFSGRRDPTWEVAKDIVKRLMETWSALEAEGRKPPSPPVLGYRGCFLREGQREWLAYRGTVAFHAAGLFEARRDKDRAFERTLIHSAPRGVIPREFFQSEPGLAQDR